MCAPGDPCGLPGHGHPAVSARRPARLAPSTQRAAPSFYGEQKCALCLSIAGKGKARGPLDLVGAKLSADDLKQWIVNPKEMTAKTRAERKPPMKAYPNLTPDDVDALVAYLQTLK